METSWRYAKWIDKNIWRKARQEYISYPWSKTAKERYKELNKTSKETCSKNKKKTIGKMDN